MEAQDSPGDSTGASFLACFSPEVFTRDRTYMYEEMRVPQILTAIFPEILAALS
jgi:hypothetical protein